jgi:hypothetical protein
MSFCLSFHQALLGKSGAYWLDDPPNLTCRDRSHQHPWTVGGCLAWLLYLALPGPRMICMRASDLPAATPHTASQHPISLSSIRPATCSSIERSEVPRCPPNGPTIDGKDEVAGSIPAGGSTPNQQARPGLEPTLIYARSDLNRRLPAICQQITNRGCANTLRGGHLKRFAI